jgi:hypothetical protein
MRSRLYILENISKQTVKILSVVLAMFFIHHGFRVCDIRRAILSALLNHALLQLLFSFIHEMVCAFSVLFLLY